MPLLTLRTVKGTPLEYQEIDDNLGWVQGTPATKVISAGIITVEGPGTYYVDTEGSAATDELTRINGLSIGNRVELKPVSGSRVITITHGANLKLEQATNFTLTSIYDCWSGWCAGGDIVEERKRNSNPA